MKQIFRALTRPERAFGDHATFRVSRFALVLILFGLYIIGTELVASFYANPYVAGVALQDAERRAGQYLFGPQAQGPPSKGSQPGSRQSGSNAGNGGNANGGPSRFRPSAGVASPAAVAVSVVVQSIAFVALAYICWFALTIFTQFLGGEEARAGRERHRHSNYLILYAWIPLGIRRVLEGILIHLQDPQAAWSAPSVAAYRRDSAITFGLSSLLPVSGLPAALASLLASLTDPFMIWTVVILTAGGRSVFRLKTASAFVQAAFVFFLIYGFRILLSGTGGSPGS